MALATGLTVPVSRVDDVWPRLHASPFAPARALWECLQDPPRPDHHPVSCIPAPP